MDPWAGTAPVNNETEIFHVGHKKVHLSKRNQKS